MSEQWRKQPQWKKEGRCARTNCLFTVFHRSVQAVVGPMLDQNWANVFDVGPVLIQHMVNVLCLIACDCSGFPRTPLAVCIEYGGKPYQMNAGSDRESILRLVHLVATSSP